MKLPTVGMALALLLPGTAQGDELDRTLVHIECSEPGGAARKGTGVVISDNGMVLTARHVVLGTATTLSDATTCMGGLGHALAGKSGMTVQAVSAAYDAAVLKYPGLVDAPHVQYCPVESRHKRAEVIAAGFPLRSATGQPSERMGILATIEPDPKGLLESDAVTASGMSGGRVTLAENGRLVGIISGALPDPATGYPNAYAVLAASRLAPEFGQFGLSSDPALCGPQERVLPVVADPARPWMGGDDPLPLGMKKGEGFCYLVRVWGQFNALSDAVEIAEIEGEYVLRGGPETLSSYGAVAQCVRF